MTDSEARVVTQEKGRPLAARVGAELAGSFLVCFAIYSITSFGSAIYGVNMAYIALGTGLAYMVVTMLFGRISGGQLNPAVTVAAMLTSKTNVVDGLLYVVAQVVGAIAAGAILPYLLPTSTQVTDKVWFTTAVNGFDKGSTSYATLGSYGIKFGIGVAIVVEVVAAAIIIAVAMHTTDENGRQTRGHSLAMGFAYALGAAMTFPITGAGMNPARSTGIAIFAQNRGLAQEPLQQLWVFWICPVLAAAIVSLILIVSQMLSVAVPQSQTVESSADFEQGEDDEDNDGSRDDAVAEDAVNSKGTGLNSEQQTNAEIGDEKPQSEHDADEGVKTH
ncbi:MAG: aquaporin [Bifidobacterium sp.]|jgi:aquaporin Z|nr:aquaporin [Bifidobacterium sp.]MCI1864529.1 aquaporin [Bifidobacterium sp.]